MNITRRRFIKSVGVFAGIAFYAPAFSARQPGKLIKILILGDSISIGYTPYVKDILANEAEVTRPDENCQGTIHGLLKIDQWIGDIHWDIIHFNFGLHDLKHVDAVTGKNSDKPEDPLQADIKTYEKNLEIITQKLKRTGAKLIFATTTPFPDKIINPLRDADQAPLYNKAALKIMQKNGVAINDLYSFILDKTSALQIPNNVHFTKEGSLALAQQVAKSIRLIIKS